MANLKFVEQLARDYMDDYGLEDWTLRLDNDGHAMGSCYHGRKLISLSRPLMARATNTQVRNTILHEIAHALVPAHNGHNWVWRNKAIEIGCDGKRCHELTAEPTAKVKARRALNTATRTDIGDGFSILAM